MVRRSEGLNDWVKWALGVVVLVVSGFITYTYKQMDSKAPLEDVHELQIAMDKKADSKEVDKVGGQVDELRKDQQKTNDTVNDLRMEQRGLQKDVENSSKKLDKILENQEKKK